MEEEAHFSLEERNDRCAFSKTINDPDILQCGSLNIYLQQHQHVTTGTTKISTTTALITLVRPRPRGDANSSQNKINSQFSVFTKDHV